MAFALLQKNNTVDTYLVRELLYEAVAARGSGYVYTDHFESCRNWGLEDKTQPQCIVGYSLWLLGVTYQECGVGSITPTLDTLGATRPELKLTLGAVQMLQAAQTVQDNGGTWGLAKAVADSSYWALNTLGVTDTAYYKPDLTNANVPKAATHA